MDDVAIEVLKSRAEIREVYEKLSFEYKVEVLELALEHMKAYNARSKLECIAMALGYRKRVEDDLYTPVTT